MTLLHLDFEPADEWYGQLVATVAAEGFGGRGGAWFDMDELRSFLEKLSAYPLSKEQQPVCLIGSLGTPEGEPAHEHMAIIFEQHDARGRIRVTARLATPVWNSETEDLACRAEIRFLATYADLDNFRVAFYNLLDGSATRATLQSSASL